MELSYARKRATKAWLYRYDGKEIKVLGYPHRMPGNLLVNLDCAVFLKKYGKKVGVGGFLNWFFANLLVEKSKGMLYLEDGRLEEEIYRLLLELPIRLGEFQDLGSDEVAATLYRARNRKLFRTGVQAFDFSSSYDDPDGDDLWRELNQQFASIRIGGRFVSDPNSRDATVLISSRYFNWTSALKTFFSRHRDEVDTVTIERYTEVDRLEGYDVPPRAVYLTSDGRTLEKIPVDDFINDPTIDIQNPTNTAIPHYLWCSLHDNTGFINFITHHKALAPESRIEFSIALRDEYRATTQPNFEATPAKVL